MMHLVDEKFRLLLRALALGNINHRADRALQLAIAQNRFDPIFHGESGAVGTKE